MSMSAPRAHPVPKIGDTVVLNDFGIQQIHAVGASHMKTLRMKVTWVASVSSTTGFDTFDIDVDNPEIDMFLITHQCFDIVPA